VANPTAEVFENLNLFYWASESKWHGEQADHLRILHDRLGTTGSNRGHWYSDADDAGARSGKDDQRLVDADNESYYGRRSLKSASVDASYTGL
jgi:hypothetical protein